MAGQFPVAGEQDAPLGAGQPQQGVIVQRGVVHSIKTEDAQPFGQATEHPVGDEPHRVVGGFVCFTIIWYHWRLRIACCVCAFTCSMA